MKFSNNLESISFDHSEKSLKLIREKILENFPQKENFVNDLLNDVFNLLQGADQARIFHDKYERYIFDQNLIEEIGLFLAKLVSQKDEFHLSQCTRDLIIEKFVFVSGEVLRWSKGTREEIDINSMLQKKIKLKILTEFDSFFNSEIENELRSKIRSMIKRIILEEMRNI